MESEPFVFSFSFFVYWYYFAWAILGLFAGIWIYKDAKKMPKLFLGSKPIWWAIAAVMLGGVWVIFVYWLIHHSTISNRIVAENENT